MLTWIWVIMKNKRLALKRKVWTAANFSSLATCLGFQPNRSGLAPSALWLQMHFSICGRYSHPNNPRNVGCSRVAWKSHIHALLRYVVDIVYSKTATVKEMAMIVRKWCMILDPMCKPKYIQSRSDDSTLRLQGYPHLETVNQFEYV